MTQRLRRRLWQIAYNAFRRCNDRRHPAFKYCAGCMKFRTVEQMVDYLATLPGCETGRLSRRPEADFAPGELFFVSQES